MTPKAAFDSKIEISEVARTDFMLDIHEFSTMEYFDGDMLEKLFGCDFIDKIKIIRGDVRDFSFSPFGMLGHKNVRKYLIDNSKTTGCLVEVGFLSNQEELVLLTDKTYQDRVAYCIYLGIIEYLGV